MATKKLPPNNSEPVEFEGLGMCFFYVVEYRSPKRGEWFLSGAIVEAYKVRYNHEVTGDYWVVVPTFKAKRVTRWEKGEQINVVVV